MLGHLLVMPLIKVTTTTMLMTMMPLTTTTSWQNKPAKKRHAETPPPSTKNTNNLSPHTDTNSAFFNHVGPESTKMKLTVCTACVGNITRNIV
jgi:hypothetical protein